MLQVIYILQIRTMTEYESQEYSRYLAEVRQVESGTLAYRQHQRVLWEIGIRETPTHVANMVNLAISGDFGKGAQIAAHNVLSMSKRANKVASLAIIVAALEWQCPASFARQAYNALTDDQKQAVNSAIQAVIDQYQNRED